MFKLKSIFENTGNNGYPEAVEKIHNEFESASEELLKQAEEVLGVTVLPNDEKVSMLERLGFTKANEVKSYKEKKGVVDLSKKQIELVETYKNRYPNNKFITQEQVKAICEKYNLVFGDVDRYTGFVPHVKLNEIAEFELHSEDKDLLILQLSDGRLIGLKDMEIKPSSYGQYYHIYKNGGQQNALQSNDGTNFYADDTYDLLGLKKDGFLSGVVVFNNSLKICAPVKDMDMSGMTIEDGYKVKKHIPDPVVLQPVDGGYLIVSKWGDEASDEILN